MKCNKQFPRDIIDFKMLGKIQDSVKNSDETELNTTFSMYLDAVGFDDLIEKYTQNVKESIEKRVNDALILQ